MSVRVCVLHQAQHIYPEVLTKYNLIALLLTVQFTSSDALLILVLAQRSDVIHLLIYPSVQRLLNVSVLGMRVG